MPYEPGKCTFYEDPELLGRQQLFACLTCQSKSKQANVICYSCSIQCHTDHDLCELFTKRNLACDCGTTRVSSFGGCNLRKNFDALDKPLNDEKAVDYTNHNFEGRFCSCDKPYNADQETGTMFQCLLGDVCGEDWYHEECILGLQHGSIYRTPAPGSEQERIRPPTEPRATIYPEGVNMFDQLDSAASDSVKAPDEVDGNQRDSTLNQTANLSEDEEDDEEDETIEGLPNVDQFDSFVCWKCIEKHKDVFVKLVALDSTRAICLDPVINGSFKSVEDRKQYLESLFGKKRKIEETEELAAKRVKLENSCTKGNQDGITGTAVAKSKDLEKESVDYLKSNPFSLFLVPDFRPHLSALLSSTSTKPDPEFRFFFSTKFPFFTQEEPTYEPPADDDANSSLLDAGAQALNAIPRHQAIQGLEAYSIIKQKLSAFFKPFAEQGKVVTETDVVGFFEKVKNERKEGSS